MKLDLDTTEKDWNEGISNCKDKDQLLSFIQSWDPFVNDALKEVKNPSFSFNEFREGLLQERKGVFAGETWASLYSSIIMPENLMNASMLSIKFAAPLIVCLERMKQEGLLKK